MPSLFPAVVFLLVHDQVQFYADILIAKECEGANRGVWFLIKDLFSQLKKNISPNTVFLRAFSLILIEQSIFANLLLQCSGLNWSIRGWKTLRSLIFSYFSLALQLKWRHNNFRGRKGTRYNLLYGDAPPKMGTAVRFVNQVCEQRSFFRLELWEGVSLSVCRYWERAIFQGRCYIKGSVEWLN